MKEAMIAINGKVASLEAALATRPAGASSENPAEPAKEQDMRTSAEIHTDTLRSFDAALAADRGDVRDKRATAERLNREIAANMPGNARVLEVDCATTFCKATIDQDTAAGGPPVDVTALIDNTPSLKTESMFDYQTVGTHKRVIVYSAREGQLLPMARKPPPDLVGAAAAVPPQP